MESQCWIELFGGLRVRHGRRTLTRFRTHKTAALLAFLAYHGDRMHSREVLVEMLWPDAPNQTAGRTSLSVALSSLRSQLEPPGVPAQSVLLADRQAVGLSPNVDTDVALFERLLDRAERARSATDASEEKRCLVEATSQYRDTLLPGHYDEWIVPQQERLAERFRLAIRRLAALHEANGDLASAIACARRAAQADPLDEAASRDLMRLLMREGGGASGNGGGGSASGGAAPDSGSGNGSGAAAPVGALRQYQRLTQALGEVGESPSAATRAMMAPWKTSVDAPVTAPAPARGVAILPRTQPAAKPSAPAADPMTGLLAPPKPATEPLPSPLTRFYGRQDELAQLQRLLDSGGSRLLTLTGPGGSGKTRLALEAARLWRRRGEGEDDAPEVHFVSLQDAESGPFLLAALRTALNVAEDKDVDPLTPIVRALVGRPVLLILDNFEQVAVAGAPLLERLLERLPELICIVTSRQRLPIPGEREIPVLPLPTMAPPRSDAEVERWDLAALLREQAAVALFVDRAQLARPDFQITRRNAASVVELTHRLEGIPLAIELAAARAQVLTPRQMLDRLNQRLDLLVSHRRVAGGRHHSLREALQFSYDLLAPDLRRFFACLAVFRGGFTTDAAEAVTESALGLDLLAQLCDASLVRMASDAEDEDGIRFTMLETVREFARERLLSDEHGIEAANAAEARHRAFFASLAEEAESHIRQGESQVVWLDRLEREHDNCRAALRRVLRHDRTGGIEPDRDALRILTGLQTFWFLRGHFTEGRSWSRQFWDRWRARPGRLGVSGENCLDPGALAKVLNGAGVLAMGQGDYAEALTSYRRSLWLRRHLDDASGVAATLANWGIAEQERENYTRAMALYERALAEWRSLGSRRNVARILTNIGTLRAEQGDPAGADPLFRESEEIAREMGDFRGVAVNQANQGLAAFQRELYADAEKLLFASLRTSVSFKGHAQAASALLCLGFVRCAAAAATGDGDAREIGAQLLRVAVESFSELGMPLPCYAQSELERFPAAAAPGAGFSDCGLTALQFVLDRWLPEHGT